VNAPGIALRWRGRVPYRIAHAEQEAHREGVLAGTHGEELWLLEHDPVVTTGRRAVADLDPERLGCEVIRTERGGLATWHGPGQLVGYLLVDVGSRGGGVRATVEAVERGVAAWLATRGVAAGPRDGHPGVWVGRDKICAIGLHFRRGVSMHGFALNLCPELSTFSRFTPCGVTDGGVTSLEREIGVRVEPEGAWEAVGREVVAALVDTFRIER
jgi:lipoate-protein ligase B